MNTNNIGTPANPYRKGQLVSFEFYGVITQGCVELDQQSAWVCVRHCGTPFAGWFPAESLTPEGDNQP